MFRSEEIMWWAVVGVAVVLGERNGAPSGVRAVVCSKTLDTADIVREAIYHHPSLAAANDVLRNWRSISPYGELCTRDDRRNYYRRMRL